MSKTVRINLETPAEIHNNIKRSAIDHSENVNKITIEDNYYRILQLGIAYERILNKKK